MKKASLKDYIKRKNTVLFQAHVEEELKNKVQAIREKYDMTWNELVEYCFVRLLQEDEELSKKDRSA